MSSKWQKLCPGHSSTILQKFTPIGASSAEMSVPGQIHIDTEVQQMIYPTKRILELSLPHNAAENNASPVYSYTQSRPIRITFTEVNVLKSGSS